MKRETNYKKLLENELEMVRDEFANIGKKIETEEDVGTYELWIERGRKVKRGEKALCIESSKPYPVPIFSYGTQVIDANGRKKFGKYKVRWSLFAKDQTVELTI